jgi:hypothetical protein
MPRGESSATLIENLVAQQQHAADYLKRYTGQLKLGHKVRTPVHPAQPSHLPDCMHTSSAPLLGHTWISPVCLWVSTPSGLPSLPRHGACGDVQGGIGRGGSLCRSGAEAGLGQPSASVCRRCHRLYHYAALQGRCLVSRLVLVSLVLAQPSFSP